MVKVSVNKTYKWLNQELINELHLLDKEINDLLNERMKQLKQIVSRLNDLYEQIATLQEQIELIRNQVNVLSEQVKKQNITIEVSQQIENQGERQVKYQEEHQTGYQIDEQFSEGSNGRSDRKSDKRAQEFENNLDEVKELYQRYMSLLQTPETLYKKKWSEKMMTIKDAIKTMNKHLILLDIEPHEFTQLILNDDILSQTVQVLIENKNGKKFYKTGQRLYYTVSLLRHLAEPAHD